MKLWQIKANALRIMFADTDLEFSENEFIDGIVYDNPNTREKLIGMDESIRRAIDTYYQFNDRPMLMQKMTLVGNDILETNDIEHFGIPLRIDMKTFLVNNDDVRLMREDRNLDFYFDEITKDVVLNDSYEYDENVKRVFELWFQMDEANLPYDIDELTYDLNDLHIPENVQRRIPLFIKGELYEEDEANLAMSSKQEYIQFVLSLRKKYGKVQKRVKTSPVFKNNR